MNLAQEIKEAEQELALRKAGVEVWSRHLIDLKLRRSQCTHEFSAAIKGYEHEGGTCIHCGINEVYAASQKIGKR